MDYQSDVYTIDTQEALKSKIKVDVKASIPLDGVKIEASAGYLNSEAVSSKSMLHIIKEVIDQPPVKADIQTLRLTEKAQALLAEDKGVEKFRAQYGDYFVYACCSKSSFTAIYDFKASSKEVLNEVKASLKLKTDVADAIANTNVSILKKESSVTIAVRLDIKGYEASKDTEGSLINTKEVETTFKKFQANAKPQPYLALLCHYSAIDGRIPGP